MLEIQSLRVNYGSRSVLDEISFNIKPGQVIALVGPNGTGKTTLIRAISGVVPVRSGKIVVNGKDLTRLSPMQRAALMAVVPQARKLPDGFTVWQTVLLGRTPYLGWMGQAGPSDHRRVRWALERVQIAEHASRRVDELSGGEQQLVLLARALAQETPIMLLDEPNAHLDLHHQSILFNMVRALAREQHLAVLMALHDLNLAALYADRVALLVGGRLGAFGSPAEVLTPSLLTSTFQVPVQVISHPNYGTPLILPDGLADHTDML